MRFLLRATFWLGLVLVLLPNSSSHPVPKLQVSTSEAFSAAKGVVTDIQNFCERQQEACMVGSRTSITLGQRAQAGAGMLYEFLSERFGSNESRSVRAKEPVPLPPARPSLHVLGPPISNGPAASKGIIIERSMVQ
jgi:Family of unknown function (DUF5330)